MATKNYTLSSNNANDFHKRVEVQLIQALMDIENDSAAEMSNEAIRKRRQYLNTVFQEQFRESQKVAKFLAKIWPEENINAEGTDITDADPDAAVIAAIQEHINTFANVSQSERIPSGGDHLTDLKYDLSVKSDIPGYIGTDISRRAIFKKFVVNWEEGTEAVPGDKRKVSVVFDIKHYLPDGTYVNALDKLWSADVVDDPAHTIEAYREEMTNIYQAVIIENQPIVSIVKKQVNAAVAAGYYDLKISYE